MNNPKQEFSKIYDDYVDSIYRFVVVKVSSSEIAEDLCSEAFAKTWNAFKKSGQNIDNVRAFLYKTASNLVADYYRKNGNNKIVSIEKVAIADTEQNLEEQAKQNSDINTMKQCLANIKEEYQNAITWRYLDEMPIADVAKLMDKTEPTTRVLLHRAVKRLKKEFDKI